jgi:hypothetical protein
MLLIFRISWSGSGHQSGAKIIVRHNPTSLPKNLYNLAEAFGLWESEGGATELPQVSEPGQDIALLEERILR